MKPLRDAFCCVALMLAGCGDPTDDTGNGETPTATPEEGPVDLRREFPAPPEGGAQIQTPDMVIPAATEKEWCYFTTYRGEDTAVNFMEWLQSESGHHVIALATDYSEEEYPDGSFIDCTDPDLLAMERMHNLYIAIGDGWLSEGQGVRLDSGTRLIIQSHYVNIKTRPILVKDAINIGFIDRSEVSTWVSTFSHSYYDFEVRPNESAEVVNRCEWQQDADIMFLLGHMHEWGTELSIEWERLDGSSINLYHYEWEPEYRDFPPVKIYEEGMLQVEAGDVFVTTCRWFNDTDKSLVFPAEMCSASGMLYPAEFPLKCQKD